MEHWAGAMACEVRNLGLAVQTAEQKAAEAVRLKAEIERLEGLPAQVQQLERDLEHEQERIRKMKTDVETMSRRENDLQRQFKEAEDHRRAWQAEREELHQQLQEREVHASRWETAKKAITQILRREDLYGVDDMVDAIKRLHVDNKRKDEELAVIKSEMREVGMGMEDELRRVAADRDALKAEVEHLSKGSGHGAQAMERQIAEYERRLLVSWFATWYDSLI
jgi:chromosome segregation ATPase